MGVIPIVNENDTVSVSEIRFGDNDTLSAITAGMVDADFLVLLTDVDGLYTGNPRSDPNARRVGLVRDLEALREHGKHSLRYQNITISIWALIAVSVTTPGSSLGTGGMQTKLIAAELATAAGVATIITDGSNPPALLSILNAPVPSSLPPPPQTDELFTPLFPPHTLFLASPIPLPSRKWSILHGLHPAGTLFIDTGAYRAVSRKAARLQSGGMGGGGGRLLPAGVVAVQGVWERMQAVKLVVRRLRSDEPLEAEIRRTGLESAQASGTCTPVGADHQELAADHSPATDALAHQSISDGRWEYFDVGRGLANYNSVEVERLKGLKSYVKLLQAHAYVKIV